MHKLKTSHFRRVFPHSFELALLLALCAAFGAGMWAQREQTELSGALVRLHVIASSDSAADQAAKLAVRDRVLAILTPALESAASQAEAVDIISSELPALRALDGVTAVTLGRERYPTRDYEGFSLPAGEYLSLRVVLGEGAGHNWWCVVFPPLCTQALAEPAQPAIGLLDEEKGVLAAPADGAYAQNGDGFELLDEDKKALIMGDDEGYVIKFRVLEYWDALKGLARGAAG